MKSDDRGIRFRAFGQRSIVSSSESSPSSALAKGSGGSSRISLSAFLNRKLPKTSVPAGTVQTKSRPFSTLVEPRGRVLPQDEQGGDKDGVNKEKRSIDKVIFQQFKLSDKEKEDCAVSCRLDEGGNFQVEEEVQESRKRKNPFQGGLLS
ncbi:hypothetical protein CRG98_019743 [Punica granatum]|uniref:Uncharacterized protein n=1 Tax=Punica granatum TaxID=22663 RepID=A0A2I0JUB9_PUNGR|nr:hypothetical protein CRG98_019743 [Punica granatum]